MKKLFISYVFIVLMISCFYYQIAYSNGTVDTKSIEDENETVDTKSIEDKIEELKYKRFFAYMGAVFYSDPRNFSSFSYGSSTYESFLRYDNWLDDEKKFEQIVLHNNSNELEAEVNRIFNKYKAENSDKYSKPLGYERFEDEKDEDLDEEALFFKYTFFPRIQEINQKYSKTGLSMSDGTGVSVLKEVESMLLEIGEDKEYAPLLISNLFLVYYFRFSIERLDYLITLCEDNKTKGISKSIFEKLITQADSRNQKVILRFSMNGEVYELREELIDNIWEPEKAKNEERQVYALLYQRAGNSNPFSDSTVPAAGVFIATFLMLGIRGIAGGMQGDLENAELNEENENAQLVLDAQIQDKRLVAGDSNTAVVLFARIFVRNPGAEGKGPGQDEIKTSMNSIKLVPSGPLAQYVYFESEDAAEWDEWRRFYLYFTYKPGSNEDGYGGLSFPLKVPLVVNASSNLGPLRKTVYFNIEKPEERLIINPKTIVLTDDSQSHPKIEAKVLSIDEGVWDYEYRIEESLENGVDRVDFVPKGDKVCNIVIFPQKIQEGAGNSITNNLIITASNKDTNQRIEAKLTVTIAKEGLTTVCEKPLSITADGHTTSELKITALSAAHGQLVTDYGLLQSIRFEDSIATQSQLAKNAFETAGFEIVDGGLKSGNLHDNTPGYYVYKLKTKREIPGQGENFHGELVLTASKDEREYRLKIPVLLDVTALGPGSKAWEIELERCRKIVGKIPEAHQERFNKFLDQRAQLLGATGLYELRHKIWKIGQTLWEAEGLSGYEDVAKWSGYIENTLNFSNWLGKLATDVLLSQHMGIFKAIAAGELYNIIVSGINAYKDGLSFDEWYNNHFIKVHMVEIIQSLGAEGIEKGADKLIAKNPRFIALSVLAYFAYFFITNMHMKKMGAVEAAKTAALNVGIASAVKFLSMKLNADPKAKANENTNAIKAKANTDNVPEFQNSMDYEKGFLAAKQKINSLVDAIDDGDQQAITRKIMDIKTDKYSIAEINKVIDNKTLYPDKIKNLVNDVFENEIKKPTKKIMDEKVLDFFKKKGYKDAELVFDSKSNKSSTVKVGSDWDVSYKVKYVDKDGYIRVKDMKAKDLKPIMEDSLYEAAGKKYGKNLGKQEFAEELMDVAAMGSDSVGGYGIDIDSALSMEDTAKELSSMNKDNVRNAIENIKSKTDSNGLVNGKQLTVYEKKVKKMLNKIKLEDPSSLGTGAGFKEFEWFNRSGADNVEIQGNMLEGMKQLSKQYNKILTPMKSIADTVSNQNTTKIPSVLTDAVDLFNRGKSPEYIDALLKKQGSSLRDVADILKSQIEGYGKLLKE